MSINKNAVEMLCGEFSFNLRGEFESKVIEITPQTATKLLSFSEGNRALKSTHVSIMIQAIKENDFVVTNNAISFDENFVLRDGHHRLKAISMAGLPIKHAVSINIPFQNFQHVDRGVTRSQADIISIYAQRDFNFPVTARTVAIARIIATIGGATIGSRTGHKKIESIIDANKNGISFLCENYNTTKKGVCGALISAPISCAFDHVPHEKLEIFCMMLSQGVSCGLKSESNAALFCRDAIISGKLEEQMAKLGYKRGLGSSSADSKAVRIVAYFVQYCIQQFVGGKDVNRIVMGAKIDKETKEIMLSPVIYAPVSVI
jgi:hypothetical protein